jgi:hypothetical protein
VQKRIIPTTVLPPPGRAEGRRQKNIRIATVLWRKTEGKTEELEEKEMKETVDSQDVMALALTYNYVSSQHNIF